MSELDDRSRRVEQEEFDDFVGGHAPALVAHAICFVEPTMIVYLDDGRIVAYRCCFEARDGTPDQFFLVTTVKQDYPAATASA